MFLQNILSIILWCTTWLYPPFVLLEIIVSFLTHDILPRNKYYYSANTIWNYCNKWCVCYYIIFIMDFSEEKYIKKKHLKSCNSFTVKITSIFITQGHDANLNIFAFYERSEQELQTTPNATNISHQSILFRNIWLTNRFSPWKREQKCILFWDTNRIMTK